MILNANNIAHANSLGSNRNELPSARDSDPPRVELLVSLIAQQIVEPVREHNICAHTLKMTDNSFRADRRKIMAIGTHVVTGFTGVSVGKSWSIPINRKYILLKKI